MRECRNWPLFNLFHCWMHKSRSWAESPAGTSGTSIWRLQVSISGGLNLILKVVIERGFDWEVFWYVIYVNEVTLSESAVSLVCLVMPCHSCCKLCQIFFNYHNVNGPSPVLAYRNKCQSCLNLRSDATAAKTKSSKQNANHMSNNPGNHVKKVNWTIIMPAAPESFRLLLVCTFSRPTWISFCFALLQQVQLPWQVAQRVVQICLHTPEKNSATVCIQIEIPWMIQTATATQG